MIYHPRGTYTRKSNSPVIAVLGSSWGAGQGATGYVDGSPAPAASWFGQLNTYAGIVGWTVTNYSVAGQDTRYKQPTAYKASSDLVTLSTNITAALATNPDIVIYCTFNDQAAGLSQATSLANLERMAQACRKQGVAFVCCRPIPRNYATQGERDSNFALGEAIAAIYPTIDTWTPLVGANKTLNASYDSGDGIHLNDAGHTQSYLTVKAYLDAFFFPYAEHVTNRYLSACEAVLDVDVGAHPQGVGKITPLVQWLMDNSLWSPLTCLWLGNSDVQVANGNAFVDLKDAYNMHHYQYGTVNKAVPTTTGATFNSTRLLSRGPSRILPQSGAFTIIGYVSGGTQVSAASVISQHRLATAGRFWLGAKASASQVNLAAGFNDGSTTHTLESTGSAFWDNTPRTFCLRFTNGTGAALYRDGSESSVATASFSANIGDFLTSVGTQDEGKGDGTFSGKLRVLAVFSGDVTGSYNEIHTYLTENF